MKKQTSELIQKDRDRARAYARMTRDDVVPTPAANRDDVAIAPNGRPYDPRSGRYIDR